MQDLNDELWFAGLDSINNRGRLPAGTYQWAQNVTNRGGMISTRQGVAEIAALVGEKPRGLCLFYPTTQGINPYLVAAIGNSIYAIPYPFTATLAASIVTGISFPSTKRAVHFEITVQAQTTDINGVVTVLPVPRFVLMMQDGVAQPAFLYYDGNTRHAGHVVPNVDHPVTPIGDFMRWAGDRLWVCKDNKMHASDLLSPTQFEEEKIEASGGWFYLPSHVTGMGVTADFKSLLVYTDQTTSAFQVGIEERTLWPGTQDFQRVIFPSIGCAAHRTIINQYGVTWWMSHDGWMGLDNALQVYQTSRMQVRDQQMARSKEGVAWGAGGGASGTFANWLLVSTPSSSQYNAHTWVMDEAAIETISAPAIWASNWTGIRPEQWVTGDVNGVQRCFCISNDLVPFGAGRQATIWEAFIGQRMDVPKNQDGFRIAKDIGCAWESKFQGLGPGKYSQFQYVELDLAEIVGNVHLQVYYCGRKTSYKKILDKKIQATVSPNTEEIFDPESLVNVWVPQSRTVRSVTDSHDADDADTEIQTQYLRSIDKEFAVLVTWTGQMTILGIRMCVEPRPDYREGNVEQDELTVRRITAEGTGEITDTPAPANNFIQAFTSKYLAPLRPRWVEFPAYDSAVGNGVFFVAVPELNPPAGGYAGNTYPKQVFLSTETVGAQLRWTINGPMPSANTGTVYDATHIPSVHVDDVLKVRGFKTGFLDSVPVQALYYKMRLYQPVFNPAPGTYPATQFDPTKTVTITTYSPGMKLRWTEDGTIPSRTHGTLINDSHGDVEVHANHTLKAIAYDVSNNYADSFVTTGQYVAQPVCATPTFTPDGGSYPTFPKDIVMATATAGASLIYTINDANMAHGITVATPHTVSVPANATLRCLARKAALGDSVIKLATYNLQQQQVAAPHLTPPGGDYQQHNITITFHCSTPNATIAYIEQHISDPPQWPDHSTGIQVRDGDTHNLSIGHKVIRMIAFRGDMIDSQRVEVEYDFDNGG